MCHLVLVEVQDGNYSFWGPPKRNQCVVQRSQSRKFEEAGIQLPGDLAKNHFSSEEKWNFFVSAKAGAGAAQGEGS